MTLKLMLPFCFIVGLVSCDHPANHTNGKEKKETPIEIDDLTLPDNLEEATQKQEKINTELLEALQTREISSKREEERHSKEMELYEKLIQQQEATLQELIENKKKSERNQLIFTITATSGAFLIVAGSLLGLHKVKKFIQNDLENNVALYATNLLQRAIQTAKEKVNLDVLIEGQLNKIRPILEDQVNQLLQKTGEGLKNHVKVDEWAQGQSEKVAANLQILIQQQITDVQSQLKDPNSNLQALLNQLKEQAGTSGQEIASNFIEGLIKGIQDKGKQDQKATKKLLRKIFFFIGNNTDESGTASLTQKPFPPCADLETCLQREKLTPDFPINNLERFLNLTQSYKRGKP